ncbi:helix-turn-helix transcriptional regulator [Polymorphospora sp. NPDC051019]|uniref:helix-turn-helix domain-containing protein n=1 Tax=Polymorphospora sp. NPDC051019 TaxID=3155725 RepID=UPI0034331A89
MNARPPAPLPVPDHLWSTTEATDALRNRDFQHIFRLVARYTRASQTTIGRACGLTQATVSKIMAGRHRPQSLDVIQRIAVGFRIPGHGRTALGLHTQKFEPEVATPSSPTAQQPSQRNLLGHLIRTRYQQTIEEAANDLRMSARHLSRLTRVGAEIDVHPRTRRVLEAKFGHSYEDLRQPWPPAPSIQALGADATITAPSSLSRQLDRHEGESRVTTSTETEQATLWLDERTGSRAGTTRNKVFAHLTRLNLTQIEDGAHRRSRVSQREVADALTSYYRITSGTYNIYAADVATEKIFTSILTRPDWLDLELPLGIGRDNLQLRWNAQAPQPFADGICIEAAIARIAESAAVGTRVINTPLYRLLDINISPTNLTANVALTDFFDYALTMDLLEKELLDTLASNQQPEITPLRDRYLPNIDTVVNPGDRLCCGGILALFAAARPASKGRPSGDYVLLIQERSGRVLNAAGRLAVIPKSFHEPLREFSDDAQISSTLYRELEEELFGRPEVDSTSTHARQADPLHPTRLSPPMRWLMDRADEPTIWRMEVTGFGFNLVSGNFEIATLILIEDEAWWREFGGYIEANWESDSLRRYSSLDRQALIELTQDPAWSNEGLFALARGLRRLEVAGSKHATDLPRIKLGL